MEKETIIKEIGEEAFNDFSALYNETIMAWIKLVHQQSSDHCWDDGDGDIQKSNTSNQALRDFESKMDLNVIQTYLTYTKHRTIRYTYPFTFNYFTPFQDLIQQPYQ